MMAPLRWCGAHGGAGVRKPPMEETAGGVERPRVRRYGDLTAVVPDCDHNLCDMARTLRTGENAFRRPCYFKELPVVKRAHNTTCALCACWQRAPNAVDDRTDHHADRSSASGPSSSGKTLPS